LQQVSVEGGDLDSELTAWRPGLRHSGAYVAPRFYNVTHHQRRPEGQISAHSYALISAAEKGANEIEDGDKVNLLRYEWEKVRSDNPRYPVDQAKVTGNCIARAMVARPLTHLTLRMLV
jgi:hypothetical protein